MDIYKAILELKAEKNRLDRAIAALEQGGASTSERPKRRHWNAEARRAAAQRMKKYWEGRKNAQSVSPPSTESA